MTPVVPGFSGFVPVDFDKTHPDVKLFSPSAWAGFEPTKFVDPRSPMFVEIGKRFVTVPKGVRLGPSLSLRHLQRAGPPVRAFNGVAGPRRNGPLHL